MFPLAKNKTDSTRNRVERESRLLSRQTIFDGFLDTRVPLENYNRDVSYNLYSVLELSETPYVVSCVYTASNPTYWTNVANLYMRSLGVSVFPAIGMII